MKNKKVIADSNNQPQGSYFATESNCDAKCNLALL